MKEKNVTTPNLQDVIDNTKPLDGDTTPKTDVSTDNTPNLGSDEQDNKTTQEPVETDEYSDVWNNDSEIDLNDLNNNDTTNPQQVDDSVNSTNELDNNELDNTQQLDNTEPVPNGVVISKPLKYKGNDISISSEDEAIALMQKGLDYEFKMSKIKPFRQAIQIIDDNGLSKEDIQALADIKDGKAEALNYIADKYNVPMETQDEQNDNLFDDNGTTDNKVTDYKPEVSDNGTNEILNYFQEYSNSEPEKAGAVLGIYNNLEPSFQLEVTNNMPTFQAFIEDINKGVFNKIYPEVVKAKALNNNISWLQAYAGVAQKILKPNDVKEPTGSVQRKQVQQRKATRNNGNDYETAWDDDTSFQEFEHQLFG